MSSHWILFMTLSFLPSERALDPKTCEITARQIATIAKRNLSVKGTAATFRVTCAPADQFPFVATPEGQAVPMPPEVLEPPVQGQEQPLLPPGPVVPEIGPRKGPGPYTGEPIFVPRGYANPPDPRVAPENTPWVEKPYHYYSPRKGY